MAKSETKTETASTPGANNVVVIPRNIYQRLSAAMTDVGYLQKDKDVAGQYKSVSFAAFASAFRTAFVKHGILAIPIRQENSIRHLPKFDVRKNNDGSIWKEADAFRSEIKLTTRLQNIDDKDDYVDVESFGAGIDNQDKDPGKAFTYALKHVLMKLLLIETGEGEESPFARVAEVETLSGEQIAKVRELCVEAALAEAKCAGAFGVDSVEDIPAAAYEDVIVSLNTRIGRVKERSAAKTGDGAKGEQSGSPTAQPA